MLNLRIKPFFISILCTLITASLLTTLSCSQRAYAANKDSVRGGEVAESEYKEFFVLSVNPEDTLPSSIKYPSIQVQFSQPVVPLAKLTDESDKSDFVTIEPALNGTFRWLGTSILSFESTDEVPPQAEYTIKVNPGIESLSGVKLTGETTFKFHTQELEALFIRPAYEAVKQKQYVSRDNVPPELANSIALFFNYPVDCDYVSKFITIYAANKKCNFTAKQLYDYAIEITLDSKSEIPFNSEVTVVLEKGAASKKGSLPVSKSKYLSFKTGPELKFESISGNDYNYPNSIIISYSRGLKEGQEETILQNLTIDPSDSLDIKKENIKIEGKKIILKNLEFETDKEYKVSLNTNLYDNFGKMSSDKILNQKVKVQKRSNAYVNYGYSDFGILEAQYEPNIAFAFKNTVSGYYGIKPITAGVDYDSPAFENYNEIYEGDYKKNEQVVVVVPLKDVLKRTADGYRGAAFFKSAFSYKDYSYWNKKEEIREREKTQVIQVTDLGISIRYDTKRALVLVTQLSSGKPVPGATVNFYDAGKDSYSPKLNFKGEIILSATTDENGFAELLFDRRLTRSNGYYIEAVYGDDSVYCAPNNTNMWRTSAYVDQLDKPLETEYFTFMFTDRRLYKPGETVTFRGIDRALKDGKYSPVKENFTLELTKGSRWNPEVIMKIASGTHTENGTFWNKVTLPENLEPDDYGILFTSDTHKEFCPITIQHFERLRFEASTSIPDITFFSGDELSATVKASYLGGGAMNGCTYESNWEREPSYFYPRGTDYESYSFGPNNGYDGLNYISSNEGKLSEDGTANLSVQSGNEKLKGTPYRYRIETMISDLGNQAITTINSVTVHPAKYYIGVSDYQDVSGFPKAGNAIKFNYILMSPDKSMADSAVIGKQMKLELIHDKWVKVQQASVTGNVYTRWDMKTETEYETTIPLKATVTPASLSVTPKEGGSYTLRLSSVDAKGNEVITEKRFYVTSSNMNWFHNDDETEISMRTDKSLYNVGDTAQIFMESPLPAGTYMITTERENIINYELRTLDKPTDVINVKIEDSFVPVMYVTVSSYSVRSSDPKKSYGEYDLGKPRGYFGLATLKVSTDSVSFDIDISSSKNTYRPGEEAEISLTAKDHNGNPIKNAEITLMAVDRGVIDLINYHVPDPVRFFWSEYNFPDCVKGGDSRYYLLDPVTFEAKNLIGGDSGDDDKMNERKNFDPTAVFLPAIKTDENGKASCKFTLPDTLTAYRITAIGVKDNNFSIKENEISVANPVSVRQVLPRQLRLNDKGELGLVLSNLDNKDHNLNVQMYIYPGIEKSGLKQNKDEIQKLPGAASVIGDSLKQVSVKANQTSQLMFQISADEAGWITVEFVTKSDVLNEKLLVPLQIEKPYIYETVTTVGQVDGDKKTESITEQLIIPSDIEDGKGQLKIILDPSRLGTLTDAISYVFHYPYGCLEQRSAAILPLALFGEYIDVLGLKSEVVDPMSVVEKEISSWKNSQLGDGGFPYWPNGTKSNTFVSARLAEIYAVCLEKGIDINKYVNINALCRYLYSNATQYIMDAPESSQMDVYNSAYIFYVLSKLNYNFNNDYLNYIMSCKKNDVDISALVALTYYNLGQEKKAASIAKDLRKYISYTTRGCSVSSMVDSNSIYLDPFTRGSSTAYALLLKLNSILNPKDDINQHLLFELAMLQKQSNGYWNSTSETSRVLDATYTYIKANNLDNLDFAAVAVLGEPKNPDEEIPMTSSNILASGNFKGVSSKPVETISDFKKAPLSKVKRDQPLNLTFSRTGKGSLYYTASMKYAVPVDQQYAKDHGITLSVIYYDTKTGKAVSEDKLIQGNTYKAKLCISTTKNRAHVAVRVPVPAGCEILNAAFATTGSMPRDNTPSQENTNNNSVSHDDDFPWSYYDDCDDEELYYAFTHRNNSWYYEYFGPLSNQAIYDSEVQYFFDTLYQGYQEMSFYFRATRKGTYNVPSATAECMYQEEIFGRTNGKIWTIE